MNNTTMCDHVGEKMSGYLDGELSQQESQRISVHISQCNSCTDTYNKMKALQEVVKQAEYPNMEQEKLDSVLNDLTSRRLQSLAWFAMISGICAILAFVVYQFFADNSTPWEIKLVISLIWGGGIGLFISVLRQRLIIRKTDKYKKVDL